MAAAVAGLRASYHRLLDRIELKLPPRFRPFYNHPAGFGLIWSRYSLVIIPKNWSLFAVNFFVGCAGGSQLFRIWRYNRELKAKQHEQLQQRDA